MGRKVSFTVREEKRLGGLIYVYPCGHEFHFTKEALHRNVACSGEDAPKSCPEGCGSDMDIIEG
jgi:hypothetical protein